MVKIVTCAAQHEPHSPTGKIITLIMNLEVLILRNQYINIKVAIEVAKSAHKYELHGPGIVIIILTKYMLLMVSSAPKQK